MICNSGVIVIGSFHLCFFGLECFQKIHNDVYRRFGCRARPKTQKKIGFLHQEPFLGVRLLFVRVRVVTTRKRDDENFDFMLVRVQYEKSMS